MPGSVRSTRKALTLIEVVASLTLLSTLLVGSIMALNRHQQQFDRAVQRQKALDATDALMSLWFSQGEPVPVDSSGTYEDAAGFHWQTRSVGRSMLAGKIPVATIEFSVFHRQSPAPVFQMELIQETGRLPSPPQGDRP